MVFVKSVSRSSLFVFFLSSFLFVVGQDSCDYTVEGTVIDLETHEPIPFANIQVNGGTQGALSDEDGHFIIRNLCQSEFDLTVSHVGYKTSVHHHDTYHESPTIMLALENQLLESVVVEGEYNATSINTIKVDRLSHEEFQQSKTESFGELASQITGLGTITTGQNIVKPIIHGLHSNRVLIINNGVRHEFQNWGAEHAPEIDPSLAGSLSVVKGAATVRYGPDALGGVILIDPPKMELSSGFKATIETIGKSNGRSGESNVSLGYGSKNLVVNAAGSIVRQGDLNTPDYQLTNTGKDEKSISASFRYHKKRFDLEGYFSHFYQNLGILRGSVNGNLEDLAYAMESTVPPDTNPFSYTISTPTQEVNHQLIKLKSIYVLDNQDFSFQYAYQFNHRKEFDVRRGSNNEVPSINLELASQSIDLDWNHPEIGGIKGSVGFQWLYQDNDNIPGTNTVPFVPNFNTTRVGLFAIERIELDKDLYELGIRYDFQYSSIRGRDQNNSIYRNELTFSQLTGSIGWKRSIRENLHIRNNLGMAWRPPNISELYSLGKHQASIEYGLWRYVVEESGDIATRVLDQDDKPIQSEVGFKYITTLEGHQENSKWEITAYVNLIKNYIYAKPAGITNTVRGAFPYFIYDQDDAFFLGVDAAWEQDLLDNFSFKVAGNYVWAKDILNDDTFLEIPATRLTGRLLYHAKPDFLSESVLALSPQYVFRYWQQPKTITARDILQASTDGMHLFTQDQGNFDFMDAPDGYFLTDISWSAAARAFSWSLQVKNLFDVAYRTNTDRLRYFADQNGRNFVISLRYTIQ